MPEFTLIWLENRPNFARIIHIAFLGVGATHSAPHASYAYVAAIIITHHSY